MTCDDWNDDVPQSQDEPPRDSPLDFDFLSLLSKPKDYYAILKVDYDASEDSIRSSYIRLALCKVCMQTFICTTSEVKCKEHAEAKHPKSDLYACFPHLQK